MHLQRYKKRRPFVKWSSLSDVYNYAFQGIPSKVVYP